MSRIDEIEARLHHEPCCDHSGRDEHGCWDCRNTGCAHPAYAEGDAAADLTALVKFAREMVELAESLEDQPPYGATSQEQWQIETEEKVARDLRAALAELDGGAS